MKDYLLIDFKLQPLPAARELMIALLDDLAYDSFEESPQGLKAYILAEDFDEQALLALPLFSNPEFKITYAVEKLDSINWNEEWERHYEAVSIDKLLYLRAPFHPAAEGYRYEIVIEPKMSFGTGHHHTTRLMARAMFGLDFRGKKVLDMGTGTGVLAILAEKMGAAAVSAIDNFDWAVENTAENARRNGCQQVEAILGDASLLAGRSFDIILANINRNVLLDDMPAYVQALKPGGQILFSGFFEHDLPLIKQAAEQQSLVALGLEEESRWVSALFDYPRT